MSQTPDGRTVCDRDGADVGNGGVIYAAIVSDMDDKGNIRILHFCRDRTEGEGDEAHEVAGCASIVLSDDNLAAYRAANPQEEFPTS